MIGARMYPSKSKRPVIVVIERHVSRDIKAVRCVEPNRCPFHIWPMYGAWIPSDHGLVNKSKLFDLKSTRIMDGQHEST